MSASLDPPALSRPKAPDLRRWPTRREGLVAFLQLFALSGLAIAQPTFDLLTKNPGALNPSGVTTGDLVVFCVAVLVVPPLVAWLLETAVGALRPSLRPLAHATIAGGFAMLISFQFLEQFTSLRSRIIIVAGLVIGFASAALVLRSKTIREWLNFLAIAPPIFAAMFFFNPQITVLRDANNVSVPTVVASHPKRVVLVVLDELPTNSLLNGHGEVDADLFPNLAALAQDATWYRNNTTDAAYTQRAVPAIVAGKVPDGSATMPNAHEYPHNLFTALAHSYRLNVHEGGEALCPPRACPRSSWSSLNSGKGLSGVMAVAWLGWSDIASPVRATGPNLYGPIEKNPLAATNSFLRSIVPSARPTLDYLHVMLPHQPWHYYGENRNIGVGPPPMYARWRTQAAAELAKQRHLLQLQTTDHLIGRVAARLRAIGEYDDAVVIVTADHGVAFKAGSRSRTVTPSNYEQIAWTPLFIKYPNQRGGTVDDRPVRSVDLFPTIADLVGAKLPWKIDGEPINSISGDRHPLEVINGDWRKQITATNGKIQFFDRAKGFQRVLEAQAWPVRGHPANRLYRFGPYENLYGKNATSLATPTTGPVVAGFRLRRIHPSSRFTPWAFVRGNLVGVRQDQSILITANDTIIGFSQVTAGKDGRLGFTASLDPAGFRESTILLRAFIASGPANAPTLTPIATTFHVG